MPKLTTRGPGVWIEGKSDQPIETPRIPPLWADPSSPPQINTQPHPPDPPPPGAWQGAGRTRSVLPTGRNPTTGAPVTVLGEPEIPFSQLPPGPRPSVKPNGKSPLTGALLFFPDPAKIPAGWELP